ncbi:hypothetical protein [Lacticaseibacillus saniviri]|uniref:DUF6414 family protein n=1 Tax=Lacticaseibacillus saniviri TaxID=931533 RepID=UPI001EDCF617|nr:hypothetical protein [Lacticaseibacillus saniviri]MCG4280873.1 hypothetical protein [Lacticaseibacillus saniviri]
MSESKKLREYIYVDNDALNSLLAQFDEGLTTLTTRTRGKNKSTSVGNNKGGAEHADIGGSIPGIVKANGKISRNHSHSDTNSVGELSQDAENIINGDYGVEILEDYLQEQLVDPSNAEVGDIVNFDDSFRLYDFDSLSTGINPETINNVIHLDENTVVDNETKLKAYEKQVKLLRAKFKNNPELKDQINDLDQQIDSAKEQIAQAKASEDNFNSVFAITEFLTKSMPSTIFISTPDAIVFAQKSIFRLSPPQLQMLQKNPRSLHIFGIVENKFENTDWEKQQITSDLLPHEIGAIPTYLVSIVLSNFGISQKEDSLQIRPISMYF